MDKVNKKVIKESLLEFFFRYIAYPNYDISQTDKKVSGKLKDIFKLWSLGIIFSFISLLREFFKARIKL